MRISPNGLSKRDIPSTISRSPSLTVTHCHPPPALDMLEHTKVTPWQGFALVVATRSTSVLSVFGSAVIITTFVTFPFFRKRKSFIAFL
jgi:hypothetical protein